MRKYYLSEKVRQFHYEADGNKHSVNLRQIVALRDFADVKAVMKAAGWTMKQPLATRARAGFMILIAPYLPGQKLRAMRA